MIIETPEGFKLLQGTLGFQELFINSTRLDECIEYMFRNNIKNISVDSFHGYSLKNLDFLSRVADYIEGITIPETYFDNQIVNTLHKLKFLGITNNKKDIIDLSNFPNLQICAVEYSPLLKGLETCQNLKDLTLSNYKSKSKDLADFPYLRTLNRLSLIKGNLVSLKGIEKLTNLRVFEIYGYSKLSMVKDIKTLSATLEELRIEKCKKIIDFESLMKLANLKKLIISESGGIKSLNFIRSLKKLEFISFWGTNVLDGDISPCLEINYVGFDNKRHYSHKVEQFKLSCQ